MPMLRTCVLGLYYELVVKHNVCIYENRLQLLPIDNANDAKLPMFLRVNINEMEQEQIGV